MSLRRPPTRIELKSDDIDEYELVRCIKDQNPTGVRMIFLSLVEWLLRARYLVKFARQLACRFFVRRHHTHTTHPCPQSELAKTLVPVLLLLVVVFDFETHVFFLTVHSFYFSTPFRSRTSG